MTLDFNLSTYNLILFHKRLTLPYTGCPICWSFHCLFATKCIREKYLINALQPANTRGVCLYLGLFTISIIFSGVTVRLKPYFSYNSWASFVASIIRLKPCSSECCIIALISCLPNPCFL